MDLDLGAGSDSEESECLDLFDCFLFRERRDVSRRSFDPEDRFLWCFFSFLFFLCLRLRGDPSLFDALVVEELPRPPAPSAEAVLLEVLIRETTRSRVSKNGVIISPEQDDMCSTVKVLMSRISASAERRKLARR